MKPQYCSSMLKSHFRASLLALCCGFASGASAQLTQSQVEDAIRNVLGTAPINFSGGQVNTVPWMWPALSAQTIGEWLQYNVVDNTGYSAPPGGTIHDVLRDILAATAAGTNGVSDSQFAALAGDIEQQLSDIATASTLMAWMFGAGQYNLADNIHNLSYTDNSRLRVYDAGYLTISNQLDYIINGAGGIGSDLASVRNYLIPIEADLAYIVSRYEAEEEADEETPDVVASAERGAEYAADVALEDAQAEYESIPLPDARDPYATQSDNTTGPSESDIFGSVDTGVSHSPLLTLVSSPTSAPTAINPITSIEVDFGRDSGFTGLCIALNGLTDWLYPLLGGLALSLKGLGMWRLVRQASAAASASGESPIVHLAYNPF